jgi:hypothetical protein
MCWRLDPKVGLLGSDQIMRLLDYSLDVFIFSWAIGR